MSFSRFFRRDTEPTLESVVGGTVLAPRDRQGAVHVDTAGAVAVLDTPDPPAPPLRWQVRTEDGWIAPNEDSVSQSLDGASLLSCLDVRDGSIAHRVAVGIVGGGPAAIVEITNDSDYAVAVGFDIGDQSIFDGSSGLLWSADRKFSCLVRTAQGPVDPGDPAAVVPLPHTATIRVVVPLDDRAAAGVAGAAAVPAAADISRGWDRHLERSFRITTGDEAIDTAQQPLQRALLTLEPPDVGSSAVATWVAAISEAGFATEADDELWRLERAQPLDLVYAVGRWAELGGTPEALEDILEPFAKAVHHAARASEPLSAPMGWSQGALAGAVRAATAIEQPDIADRLGLLAERSVRPAPVPSLADVQRLLSEASSAWSWPDARSAAGPASALRSIRHLVIDESEPGIDLLPGLDVAWRGRPIEGHRLAVGAGVLSWGVRWHGARPALLWDLARDGDAYFRLQCTSVSEEWEAIEESGEELLPDPGWEQPGA